MAISSLLGRVLLRIARANDRQKDSFLAPGFQWQLDAETGPFLLAAPVNGPAVRLSHLARDGQAQTNAFGLTRDKWLEQARRDLLAGTGTGIAHLQKDPRRLRCGALFDRQRHLHAAAWA